MSAGHLNESTRQTTPECRENAARSRQVNDWFSHEHATSPHLLSPSSPARGSSVGHHNGSGHYTNGGSANNGTPGRALSPNKTGQESEEWYRHDGVPAAASPRSHSTADTQRIHAQQNSSNTQDWYKHGADYADMVDVGVHRSKFKPRRSGDARKKSDSNDWYRHDQAPGANAAAGISSVPEGRTVDSDKTPRRSGASNKESALSPFSQTKSSLDAQGNEISTVEAALKPRMKLTGPEAEGNYKRDKVGSSSDWYTHDHPPEENPIPSPNPSPTRFRVGKAGQEIADRLKVESDSWFDHDANRNYTAPLPAVKGSSPLTREMIERAKGGEMRQIFQMEQNLKPVWTAPVD